MKKIHTKNQRKKMWLGIMSLMLILYPAIAYAAPSPDLSAAGQVIKNLLAFLTIVQQFLHNLLMPVLLMIGSLLQNDLLYGGPMEENLLRLWVSIRDIVNVFFVLILVGIALYNVVGGPDESFQIKAVLPKFIIGLIAVNFSYLGVKVVLDAVNVVTTGIFALPNTVEFRLEVEKDNGKTFCEALYGADDTTYKANIANATKDGGVAFCRADKTIDLSYADDNTSKVAEYFNTYNARNAALALAFGVQKIGLIDKVSIPPGREGDVTFILNFLYSIVLYIVYATAFIALFCVLLVRLVILWLLIVLSPLIALKAVLPESLQSALGGGEDIGKQFIKHAIVPIPIALVLVIGFILLKALDKAQFTDITLNFSTVNVNLLTSGISTLQQLIAALGTVAFIWKGVFDAAKDTYAAGITDSIKGFVGGIGSALGKVPALLPIFPTGKGDVSLGALWQAGREIQNAPDRMMQKQAQEAFSGLLGPTSELTSGLENARGIDEFKRKAAEAWSMKTDKEVQKSMGKFFDKRPHEFRPEWLPNDYKGKQKEFMEALSNGSLNALQMEEFYKNAKIPQGTAPAGTQGPPGTAPVPTAAPTAAEQAAMEDFAKKHHVDPDQFKGLMRRGDLKTRANLNDTQLAALGSVEQALKNKDENALQTALQNAKDPLKKLADADKDQTQFDQKIIDIRNKTMNPEDKLKAMEKELQDAFKKISGKAQFDPNTKDKKDLEIIGQLQSEVAPKFSEAQAKELASAPGYQNSITSKVIPEAKSPPSTGTPPAPPAGKH
jgi:hypothetical protein